MDKNDNEEGNITNLEKTQFVSLNKSVILIASGLVIFYLIIVIVRISYPNLEHDSLKLWQFLTDLLTTIAALITTAIAVAWLNVTIEKETRSTFIKLLHQTVMEALLLDDKSIKGMTKEKKKGAIRLVANDLINNIHLVDFLMSTLEKSTLGWRSDVDYKLRLEVNTNSSQPDFKYKLRQRFSYTQNYDNFQIPKQREIKIGFALNKNALDEWLKEDGWFFREVIYEKYQGNADEDLSSFINNELKFELWIGEDENNIERVLNTSNSINNKGITIIYSLPATNRFFAKICFDNNRADKHFLVTLPSLTKSATISLVFDDDKIKADGYDFFTCNSNTKPLYENHAGTCQFKIKDQWLFPVSGVMFVWDEISTNKIHEIIRGQDNG